MADFNQKKPILKLRIYSRQLLKYHVLSYLECCKNPLSKGVKILLGQLVLQRRIVAVDDVIWWWIMECSFNCNVLISSQRVLGGPLNALVSSHIRSFAHRRAKDVGSMHKNSSTETVRTQSTNDSIKVLVAWETSKVQEIAMSFLDCLYPGNTW